MPVGRVYQPPPKRLINPFLESDLKHNPTAKRNFVVKKRTYTNHENKDVNGNESDDVITNNEQKDTKTIKNKISIPESKPSPAIQPEPVIVVEEELGELSKMDIAEDVSVEPVVVEAIEAATVMTKPETAVEDGLVTNGHVEDNKENGYDDDEQEEEEYEEEEVDQEEVGQVREEDFISNVERNKALFSRLPEHAKGLKNLGNTCFMNSILQCLAHNSDILAFCQEFEDSKTKLRKANPRGRLPSNITGTFVKLVRDMWKPEESSSSLFDRVGDPSVFKREIGAFANKFLGFEQHDSQEFLQYALEGVHIELNRVDTDDNNNNSASGAKKLAPEDDPESPGLTPSEVGRRCWRLYLNRDSSLVTDLFLGQFRSTLRCTVCDHESVTFEPFWVVSVPIPSTSSLSSLRSANVSVQDCLDLFVKEETLDGDEKPTCESCKTRTKCIKWYAFERWPQILVIHLKRFAPGERFRSKLSTHVDVPVEGLELSEFSTSLNPSYDLYGVSNHSGTLYGGHYTAYCKNPNSGKWHLYNDRMVSTASKLSVVSHEAYVLFFERTSIKAKEVIPNDEGVTVLENGHVDELDEDEEW